MKGVKQVGIGEKEFGKGPFSIDDVTSNAVVVLCSRHAQCIGVLNMDALDAPASYQIVGKFIDEYLAECGQVRNFGIRQVSATLVGGAYRQHQLVDQGVIVHRDFDAAKTYVGEALELRGLKFVYRGQDVKATKSVMVTSEGAVTMTEHRVGLNRERSTMSWEKYETTIDKKCI